MFLNEDHGLKDKVCHKILFKIIIVEINGIFFKILVLVEIIIGNNLSRVSSSLIRVGSRLSRVDNNLSRVGRKS